MEFARRMSQLGTETAFEVLARAKALEAQGHHIVHLEIGEPDFPTPPNVIEAGCRALRDWCHPLYARARHPRVASRHRRRRQRRRGMAYDADDVVVTPGGKPIMFFSILALVDEGDEVVYPNPGFPIYESMIQFVGGRACARTLPGSTRLRAGCRPPLRRDWPTHPPVDPELATQPHRRCAGARRAGADRRSRAASPARMVLSDEIYSRMLYDGEHVSIASLPEMRERTIVLDGFSKIYAMTGWRLGYGLFPRELVAPITRLMVNSNSCTAAFTQWAGVEALTGPQSASDAMVAEFRLAVISIVAGLNAIPGCDLPHAARSILCLSKYHRDGHASREVADLLLAEAGVAALAGTAFGAHGEGYFAYHMPIRWSRSGSPSTR